MATLNGSLVADGQISWQITGLSEPANTYSQFRVTTSDGKSTTWTAGGTGSTTPASSTYGHSCGTTITGTATATLNGTTYTVGTKSVTTQACPLPATPSAPTLSGRFNGGFNLSWGSVSGASTYELGYKQSSSGTWLSNTYSGTSTSLNLGVYGITYDLRVRCQVSGVWSNWSGVNTATTNPRTPSLVGSYNSATATLTVNGMSGGFDAVSVERRLISNDSLVDTKTVTVNGGYVQWTIAPADINKYYFRAVAYINISGTYLYSLNYSGNVSFARPNNFEWSTSKVSDQPFNLKASEWNALLTSINQFRNYKGLSAYSFTSAIKDADTTAIQFNQAVTAINAMSPPTSAPSSQAKDNDIYASLLNGLRNSLNSIN